MLSRRRLLERSVAAAFAAYLAACGKETGGARTSPDRLRPIAKGEIAKSMTFSNWPLYIDEDHRTLTEFQREYGTKVRYVEEVTANQEFFGKVRQQYARGDSGGRDLHVVSDYMAARMMRLGYVQKLDRSQLPNVEANLIERLRRPSIDPHREFTVPWQSGMTGLIYRKDKVKREPKSIEDLFDPAYKGKVTLLSEMTDTVPMVMLGMGKDPAQATVDGMLEAVDRCEREVQSGQIRGFTGNEYTKDITKGDSWLLLGWSGDAIQLQADNPNIRFVQPEEGFLLWSDEMQIPVGAPHAYTAEKFMDFVYRPEVQVDITEWVNYVCPVEGVRELIERRDPNLARSDLIFPSTETLARATDLRPLKPDEEQQIESAFQRVLGA
ncbi:MAG: spermidine/putrescine transport system substrate-binding protein [Thermoleophilaceae bacterium]|nr:spermidine/putrescine transport system substrate-binding protein [Thermoleophilaceae bacterium]